MSNFDNGFDFFNKMLQDLKMDQENGITDEYRFNNGSDDDMEVFMSDKEVQKMKGNVTDEENQKFIPDESEAEERLHFRRYSKRRIHKYTEKEMEEIRQSCLSTIVNDYAEKDIYHISDEERNERNMLHEITNELFKLKRTYRRVDQYVEAMRVVVRAWELLAKNNFLHTDEEFFDMVSKGEIVSGAIIMPKLKRIDKYDQDILIKYISNPQLDPKDLLPEDVKHPKRIYDSWYDQFLEEDEDEDSEKTPEERAKELQEKEEREKFFLLDNNERAIINGEQEAPDVRIHYVKRSKIKGYDQRRMFSRRKRKKISKSRRYEIDNLHDMLVKIQTNPQVKREYEDNRSRVLSGGIFDVEKPEKDFWDDKYFEGSWADKNAVELYDIVTREEALKEYPDTPNSRYMTLADIEMAQFWKTLEDAGMNVVYLRQKVDSGTIGSREETKRKTRNDKKLETDIIQRITKLNQSDKFKKLVSKAEKKLNNYYDKQ